MAALAFRPLLWHVPLDRGIGLVTIEISPTITKAR